jgi:hypothetical protein
MNGLGSRFRSVARWQSVLALAAWGLTLALVVRAARHEGLWASALALVVVALMMLRALREHAATWRGRMLALGVEVVDAGGDADPLVAGYRVPAIRASRHVIRVRMEAPSAALTVAAAALPLSFAAATREAAALAPGAMLVGVTLAAVAARRVPIEIIVDLSRRLIRAPGGTVSVPMGARWTILERRGRSTRWSVVRSPDTEIVRLDSREQAETIEAVLTALFDARE